MPFHHVRAGLLYTDNYLSTSLPETSEEQLANISTEDPEQHRQRFRSLDLGEGGRPFVMAQQLRDTCRRWLMDLSTAPQRSTDSPAVLRFDNRPLVSTPQFDMQQMSLEELKHVLFHAFRDHLTMKDIENIIVTEEESLKENSGNCQTEFQGVHSKKKNRQTCVRKSLICAFAMAFIISVMLIAANQMLRNGME
uniref:SCAN box domain-containing protein n=1 Tax=Sinocyclocheilus grahami TaxID=75366 RepID=A0A672R698_SINGR